MNSAKWDAIAEAFAAGDWVPANGWHAWSEQAIQESVTIRSALPHTVITLVEIGCGVGRLTPYLATLFPYVLATDTSAACRAVTAQRCVSHSNVRVWPLPYPNGDAALAWGNLYDSDWSADAEAAHRETLRAQYAIVLEGNERRWLRWDRDTPETLTGQITTFEP